MLTTCSSSLPFPLSPFLAGCFAALCPCIVYSRNRQHLRSLQYQGTPLPTANEQMDEHCCIYCGLVITGYQWVLHVRPEDADYMRFRLILGVCRFALAKKSVSAMVFVVAHSRTASSRGAAAVVLSHRSTGKLSWRREISSEGDTGVVLRVAPRTSLRRLYYPLCHDFMTRCSKPCKILNPPWWQEFERIHADLL